MLKSAKQDSFVPSVSSLVNNEMHQDEITLDNWQNYLGQTSRLTEFRRVFS